MNWKEFYPSIAFLGKFLGIYVVASLLYGWYVQSYVPRPDPVTQMASSHTAALLRLFDYPVADSDSKTKPTTQIRLEGRSIISIYEGCNGVNTAIIFVAFLIAFSPVNARLLWFCLAGLLIIHLANLARLSWLFLVAIRYPDYLYFSHKYLFTALIYLVIFALWMLWVIRFSRSDAKG